jgi:CheY-like chemotaxis protein
MSKVKVLIVEDEIIVAWDLKQIFERLGSEVLPIAASAEQAVEQTRTGAPDLILMDITLKGDKTGIAAAAEIRQFSQVPIIYLTGNTRLMGDPAIHATLAQGFYAKPHSEPQLREMLKIARKKKSLE